MILRTRMLCPKSWKSLFLLSEYKISFIHKNITLTDEVNLNIKFPLIDSKNDLQYILENIDIFVSNNDYGSFGSALNHIDMDFIYGVVLPIRFERVVKPLVYRTISAIEHLNKLRSLLKEKLIEFSKSIDRNMSNYEMISLSSAIAVLDYLGEINWNNDQLTSLYHWYLTIKSKKNFQVLLNETCPGIQPHINFTKKDF